MTEEWPTKADVARMVVNVFHRPNPSVDEALALYLFLPIVVWTIDGATVAYRSSLEALLTDTRGAVGRDENGAVVAGEEKLSQSWLGAMGYLALIDQVGSVFRPQAPRGGWPKGTNAFERILIWDGAVTADEAAALYALRCAMVHSFGLSNDPRPRVKTPARVALLLHQFELDARGGDLIQLGSRMFPDDVRLDDIDSTVVDLRTLGDVVEQLVRDLRECCRAGRALPLGPDLIDLTRLKRECFFTHTVWGDRGSADFIELS